MKFPIGPVVLALVFGGAAFGAEDFRHGQPPQPLREANLYAPDLTALAKPQASELRELVERFTADRDTLAKYYSVPGSMLQLRRFREFYQAWQAKLEAMPYESLGIEGRIDWHLMRLHLRYELGLLARAEKRNAEMAPFMGFADAVAGLQETRRQFDKVDPEESAAILAKVRQQIEAARKTLESDAPQPSKIVAYRAASRLGELGKTLKNWFEYYDTYDPQFGWWVREPYKKTSTALDDYAKFLREKIVGAKAGEDEPIIGDPIGAEGLKLDLEHDMRPYQPEQLIAVAEKEFAWCEAEWRKVAHDMGLGDDWKAALEKVKHDYVAPGDQPGLIAKQAYEAIDFVTKRDLITVPPLAIDDWLMTMMSPERQKTNPFFLGGDRIIVSFPTDTMDEQDKLDSLRANNTHFCHATVFHELIPGHHLQGWYAQRFNPHRELYYTPFYIEGWALWWEFHLWDLGFHQTPEDRAGALFWRTHRCARIIFSLNFHLGKWTPQQCIDFLVDKVGHDRHTATGEVRRSFNGDYSPLYQVGYMMGAIQLRTLYGDAVKSGRMTEKDFHDSVLKGGIMPIEMVRAHVLGLKLPRDYASSWKFVGENP
ncbi:MAG: X-Pro dipeptidyl-peptidase [Lacunisphaera sp.]|nr:X-Pro dipeptidyl-peptidase [Lacunisphaera sp.]